MATEELYFVYGTALVIVLFFIHQAVSRKFDPFAPIWLFLIGYLQVYVLQAVSFHSWAIGVRGKEGLDRRIGRAGSRQ